MRAAAVVFVLSEPSSSGRLISLSERMAKNLAALRGVCSGEAAKKLTSLRTEPMELSGFVRDRLGLDFDVDGDLAILFEAYVLTLSKRPGAGEGMPLSSGTTGVQFTYPDKTSYALFTDNPNGSLSISQAKSMTNRLQRDLSERCCALIARWAGERPLPAGLQRGDRWGRQVLPAFVSYSVLMDAMVASGRLVLLKSFVCQTIHSPPHATLEVLYRGGARVADQSSEDPAEPCLVLEGVTISSMSGVEVLSQLAGRPLTEIVLANAAQWPQYGNACESPDCTPQEMEALVARWPSFEAHLATAHRDGFSRVNPALFFVNHVYSARAGAALRKLRVGVPEGDSAVHDLLKACRYKVPSAPSGGMSLDLEHEVEFHYLPASDIASYVATGALDCGIAPSHLCKSLEVVLDLPHLGNSTIVALALAGAGVSAVLPGHTIATPHMDLARGLYPECRLVQVSRGSLLALQGGFADVVVDTLEALPSSERSAVRSLAKVAVTNLALVSGEGSDHDRRILFFRDSLARKTKALKCVKVQCQVPRENLTKPAITALPFAAIPLVDPAWIRIEAVIPEKLASALVDDLHSQCQARSITVLAVSQIHNSD